MSRRDRIDPETARLVEERLQWLLHGHGPVPECGYPNPQPQPRFPARCAERPCWSIQGAGSAVPSDMPGDRARPARDERRWS